MIKVQAYNQAKFKIPAAIGIILVLFFLSCLCIAQQAAVLVVNDTTVNLKPYLSFWVTDSSMTIEEVSLPENSANFQLLIDPVIEFDNWVWYRFSLIKSIGLKQDIFLNFNESFYDELLVFTRQQGSWESYVGGLRFPHSARPVADDQLVFPVKAKEGEVTDIYFRLKTSNFSLFNPKLQVAVAYFEETIADNKLTMLIIGLVMGMLIYMISITFVVRKKKKIVSGALFLFSAFLMVVYYNGYLFPYMNAVFEWQQPVSLILFSSMTFWGGFFVLTILSAEGQFQGIAKIMKYILVLFLLPPIFVLVGYYEQMVLVQSSINIVFPMLLFGLSAYGAYKNVVSGGWYFLAVLFYLGIQTITMLTILGIVDYYFITRHYFELATLSLGLFLSIAITNSVYQRRVRQEDLERIARVAEARDQTKSEFLAAMSHEIRTPINGVLGMAQMLQRTSLDQTQRYYSNIIITAGKTLLNIINDVLDFSKIEAGKLELEKIDFNLGELIAHISILFGSSRKNDRVDFELLSDPKIPMWISGDRVRLLQIINNLLSNAFKFTEQGKVEFKVDLVMSIGPSRARLKFSVVDSGIGISDDLKKRLFTPYVQADKSTTRKFGGTGLGLSICKQLVGLMDGEIGVESEEGAGACFWFTIDVDVVEEKQQELLRARSALHEKSVGIVLSDPRGQQLFAKHFVEWGMSPHCVDQSILPNEVDYSGLDLLVVGSSLKVPFQHWLDEAEKHALPVLLLNPINDTGFEGEYFQNKFIKYLKMPASLTQLQYALLDLLGNPGDAGDELRLEDATVPSAGLSVLSVLVAEDNVVNLKVIEALLKSLAVDAEFLLDGKAVLEHYCSAPERYNVILMDCEMPNMDGFEAARQIRAFEQQQQIRPVAICALTAHALDDIARRCQDAGMDHVLIKPIDLGMLTRQLQYYVDHSTGSPHQP